MHKQKGVVEIVLVVLLVAALGAAGYFYLQKRGSTPLKSSAKWFVEDEETLKDRYAATPTPDQTVGWKEYRDDVLNLSFKYPEETFAYVKKAPNPGLSLYLAPKEGVGEARGTPLALDLKTDVWINITVIDGRYKSLEEYIQSQEESAEGITPLRRQIKIDRKIGYVLTFNGPQGPQGVFSHQASLENNRKIYGIHMFAFSKEILSSNSELFDQILSTFRFD